MSRPTERRLQTPQGFAPAAERPTQLGVYAPLDVRAAPPQSARLLEALGLVNQAAQPLIKQWATEQRERGAADAVLGRAREDGGFYYRDGAFRATVERRGREAIAAVEQRIQSEHADASPEERAALRDSYLRESLLGLENDPEAATVLAPLVQRAQAESIQRDTAAFLQAARERAVNDETANIQARLSEGTFDYNESVERLTPRLGREDAVAAVVAAVAQSSVALRDETLIDRAFPETITTASGQTLPGPRSSAKHSPLLTDARERARGARLAALQSERTISKGELETAWQDDITKFTDDVYRHWLYQKDSLFTQDELQAWRARRIAHYEALARATAVNADLALDPLRRLKSYVGEVGPDGKPLTNEDMQRISDRQVENRTQVLIEDLLRSNPQAAPAEQRAILVASAAAQAMQHGYTYRPLQSELETVSPANFAAWEAAVADYNAMPPEARSLYVTSDDQRARFERFNALVEARLSPREAAQQMAAINPAVVQANRAAQADAWKKERDKLPKREIDAPWLGRNVPIKEVANRGQVERMVDSLATAMIDIGTSADVAYPKAVETVLKDHVLIRGPRAGTHLLIPRNAGATSTSHEDVEWFYRTQLPAYLQAKGITDDPREYRLSVIGASDQNALLTVVRPDGFPVDISATFTLPHLAQKRDQWRRQQGRVAAEQAAAEARRSGPVPANQQSARLTGR